MLCLEINTCDTSGVPKGTSGNTVWRALKGAISQSRETGLYLSAISRASALLQYTYHTAHTSAAQQHMHTRNDPDPSVREEDGRDVDSVGP